MVQQLFQLDENRNCKYNVASKLLHVDHCKYMGAWERHHGMSDVARAVVASMNYSQHSAMSRSQLKMPFYLQRMSGALKANSNVECLSFS